jgi:hypothetical protein
MLVSAFLAAGRIVSRPHGFGMMPVVRKVHIIGVKAMRPAGGAVKAVPILILTVEDFGQGVH